MKVCDRCLNPNPEATLTLVIKAGAGDGKRDWDFCKSCVKEIAAWIKESTASAETLVKLFDSAKGTKGESK